MQDKYVDHDQGNPQVNFHNNSDNVNVHHSTYKYLKVGRKKTDLSSNQIRCD